MQNYPVLVKYTHNKIVFDEDEFGNGVLSPVFTFAQFGLVESEDEFADMTERVATSEGTLEVKIIGHIATQDMTEAAILLLAYANEEKDWYATHCPNCNSRNFDVINDKRDINSLRETCMCHVCNAKWTTAYCLYDQIPKEV